MGPIQELRTRYIERGQGHLHPIHTNCSSEKQSAAADEQDLIIQRFPQWSERSITVLFHSSHQSGEPSLQEIANRCSSCRRSQRIALAILGSSTISEENKLYFLSLCRGFALRSIVGAAEKEPPKQIASSLSLDGRRVLLEMGPKQYSTCAKLVLSCFDLWKTDLELVWPTYWGRDRGKKISFGFAKDLIKADRNLFYFHKLLHPGFFSADRKKLATIDPSLLINVFSSDAPLLKQMLRNYCLADFQQIPIHLGGDTLQCFLSHLSEHHIEEALRGITSRLPHFDKNLGSIPRAQIKAQLKQQLSKLLATHPLYLIVFLSQQNELIPGSIHSLLVRCLGESRKILECLKELSTTESDRLLFNCYSALPFAMQKHLFYHCDEQGHERILDAMPREKAKDMLYRLEVTESMRLFPLIMHWGPSELQLFFYSSLGPDSKIAISQNIATFSLCSRFITEFPENDLHNIPPIFFDAEQVNRSAPAQLALLVKIPGYAKEALALFDQLEESKRHILTIFCPQEILVEHFCAQPPSCEIITLEPWEIESIVESRDLAVPSKTKKENLCLEYYRSFLEENIYLQDGPNKVDLDLKLLSFINLCIVAQESVAVLEKQLKTLEKTVLEESSVLKNYNEDLCLTEENADEEPLPQWLDNFDQMKKRYLLMHQEISTLHRLVHLFENVLSYSQSLSEQDRSYQWITNSLSEGTKRYLFLKEKIALLKPQFHESIAPQYQFFYQFFLPKYRQPVAKDDLDVYLTPALRYHALNASQSYFTLIQTVHSKLQIRRERSPHTSNQFAASLAQKNSSLGTHCNEAIASLYGEAVTTLSMLPKSDAIDDFSLHYSYDEMVESELFQMEKLQEMGIDTTYCLAKAILSFYLKQRGIGSDALKKENITLEELLSRGIFGVDEIESHNIHSVADIAVLMKKRK